MPHELANTINDLGKAFEGFRAQYDGKLGDLEKTLSAIETYLARGGLPGGGSSFHGDVAAADVEYTKQFLSWARSGNDADLKSLGVRNALATDEDPKGGFLVPEEVESSIDRVLAASSAIRRVARLRKISTGTYKRLISQGGCESGWTTEKGSRDETDTPTLREIAINAMELYAKPKTTQTLLDDAAYDVGAWLQDEIETAFADQEGAAFITGNGVGRPKGILAYDTIANSSYAWGKLGYIAGGHGTLLNNVDKLLDLQHSLKRAYRPGAVWVMNDTTWSVVRKFKGGDGNYIWNPGLLTGAPDILLGSPVEIDDFMPDIGADEYPIAYGNFQRGYLVVDRIGTRVLRDPYTEKPYVLFYTTKRVGGQVIMYEAIKLLKIATS
jgi:HK97 family phage major capsid protein